MTRKPRSRHQGGFTLIEVMLMVFLIAVGGSGTLVTATSSLRVATDAQALDASAQYANGIIERARSVPYLSLGMATNSCAAGEATCESLTLDSSVTPWSPDPTPLKSGGAGATTFSTSTAGCLPDAASTGMYAACGKEIVASSGTKLTYDVHLSVGWVPGQNPTLGNGSSSFMGTKVVTVRMVRTNVDAAQVGKRAPIISTFSGTRTALLGDAVPGGVNVAAVAATAPAGRANLALGAATVKPDGSTVQTLNLNWTTIAGLQVFTGTSPGNLYAASNSTAPAATVNVGGGTGSTTVDVPLAAGAAAPCYWGRFNDSANRVGFTPVVCAAQLVPTAASATTVNFATSPVADSQLKMWTTNPGATGGCVAAAPTTSSAVTGSAISASGLAANTQYYFQVTGTNDSVAVCSNIVAVRTAPTAPTISAFVTGKNVSATSSPRDASATWSVAPGATSYTLQYSADPTFGTSNAVTVTAASATAANGTTASARFSLLGSASRYYLRVMATAAITPPTTTAYSPVVNTYVELPAPVLSVAATANTYNLDASWQAVAGATGYRLEWGTSSTLAGATTVFPTCTTATCSYRITAPTGPTRQYYVRVTATVDSLSASSAIVAAQTAQTLYSCPSGGSLSGASTDPSTVCETAGYSYTGSYYSYSYWYVSGYLTTCVSFAVVGGRFVCTGYSSTPTYSQGYSSGYTCPSGGTQNGSQCYIPSQSYPRASDTGNGTRTYP